MTNEPRSTRKEDNPKRNRICTKAAKDETQKDEIKKERAKRTKHKKEKTQKTKGEN
jgi:hypothetical protein